PAAYAQDHRCVTPDQRREGSLLLPGGKALQEFCIAQVARLRRISQPAQLAQGGAQLSTRHQSYPLVKAGLPESYCKQSRQRAHVFLNDLAFTPHSDDNKASAWSLVRRFAGKIQPRAPGERLEESSPGARGETVEVLPRHFRVNLSAAPA